MILRYVSLIVAVVAGLFTSQLPEYSQQYRQRLGGAIDELSRILADFDADAARNAMTREQGVGRLKANPDEFVRDQGQRVQENSARLARLRQQLIDYASAGPLARIAVMLRDFDPQVGRRAVDDFEPAVPLTSEGAIATAAGAAGAWALLRLLVFPFRRRGGAAKRA